MHYLIIRPGAIGDSLLSFPLIRALKAQNNHSVVTFVSNGAVLQLALDTGIAEEALDYSSLQWSELFSTIGVHSPTLQARLQYVDSAICWLRDPEGIVERNLRALGIQHVIIAPGRPAPDERIHIVDYLARTIEFRQFIPSSPLLPVCNISTHEHRHIAIHPGSGGVSKCWPVAHFASLIEELWQNNIPVLLLAGPADHERLADLLHLLPSVISPTLLSILIDESLSIVAQQLQHCLGYIGNDCGITHLAALLATPTIVLFGPSDPVIWRPYGSLVKVIYERVLTNLSPNVVLYTIKEFFYSSRGYLKIVEST